MRAIGGHPPGCGHHAAEACDAKTPGQIEELTRPLTEAIHAESRPTQAAAKAAAPPTGLQRVAAQMRELNDVRRSALNIIRMTPGSGDGAALRCPPESCDRHTCIIDKNICICLFCWVRLESGARAADGPAGPPSGQEGDLLVVAAPADANETEAESLVLVGLTELRSRPVTLQAVIRILRVVLLQ